MTPQERQATATSLRLVANVVRGLPLRAFVTDEAFAPEVGIARALLAFQAQLPGLLAQLGGDATRHQEAK